MTREKINNSKPKSDEAIKRAEEREKVWAKRIISKEDVDRYDYDDTYDKFCYNDYVNG